MRPAPSDTPDGMAITENPHGVIQTRSCRCRYQGVWGVLSGFQWSPAATPLVAGLAGELRRRYVALIQRAYATLTAAQLAAYLGVDQAEALQRARSWTSA